MKKQEGIMIVIILIIVVFLIGILVNNKKSTKKNEEMQTEGDKIENSYVEDLLDGSKVNTSDKLGETKYLEGLEISNIQIIYKNGETVVTATVTNKTETDKELTPIKLTAYDVENRVLEEVNHGLISPVKAGESVLLNIGTSLDWSNAYDIKIEKQ